MRIYVCATLCIVYILMANVNLSSYSLSVNISLRLPYACVKSLQLFNWLTILLHTLWYTTMHHVGIICNTLQCLTILVNIYCCKIIHWLYMSASQGMFICTFFLWYTGCTSLHVVSSLTRRIECFAQGVVRKSKRTATAMRVHSYSVCVCLCSRVCLRWHCVHWHAQYVYVCDSLYCKGTPARRMRWLAGYKSDCWYKLRMAM